MNIKKELKITRTTYRDGYEAIRLNMPVRKIYDALGAPESGFIEKLKALGFTIDAPVMASEEDVADYAKCNAKLGRYSEFDDIETPEDKYAHDLENELSGMVYYDTETIDKVSGKHGLADSNGKVVVPAKFDACFGCRDMPECDSLAVVRIGENYYLTPRDGSGRLINRTPYSSVSYSCSFGWVKRGDKCGLIDIKTGRDLIPCDMDWMHNVSPGFVSIIGKEGGIGLYDNFLDKYIPPRFTAYDFATNRFCREGDWGWVRRSGRFTTKAPEHIYDIFSIGNGFDSILNEADEPRKPDEKGYYTEEELEAELKKAYDRIKRERERTLASYLELPTVEIPDGVKADAQLTEIINQAVRQLRDREKYVATIIVNAVSGTDAPEMEINLERKNRKVSCIEVSWRPRDMKTAWRDAQFDGIRSFHQILRYGDKGPKLTFRRDFGADEAENISRFVIHYYLTVWHTGPEQLRFGRHEVALLLNKDGRTEAKILPLDKDYNVIIPGGYSPTPDSYKPAEQVFEEIEDMHRELMQADDPQAEARRLLSERQNLKKRQQI